MGVRGHAGQRKAWFGSECKCPGDKTGGGSKTFQEHMTGTCTEGGWLLVQSVRGLGGEQVILGGGGG